MFYFIIFQKMKIISLFQKKRITRISDDRELCLNKDGAHLPGIRTVRQTNWQLAAFLPKSASFSSPVSLMRRFCGFRSLCRIYRWWMYDSPRSSWNKNSWKDRGERRVRTRIQINATSHLQSARYISESGQPPLGFLPIVKQNVQW